MNLKLSKPETILLEARKFHRNCRNEKIFEHYRMRLARHFTSLDKDIVTNENYQDFVERLEKVIGHAGNPFR